jgi:hypothetical protein
LGAFALRFNTSTGNTAVGANALNANTSGRDNVAIGADISGTAAESALSSNTTGSANVAIGNSALGKNTTASNNTALGYQAGYTNQSGQSNVYVGTRAGLDATANSNVFVGKDAGLTVSSGGGNTYVGFGSGPNSVAGTGAQNTTLGYLSGNALTTGSKNTILGSYDGNQNGLDIRTASNRIVLSDGDGNPRGIFTDDGNFLVGAVATAGTVSNTKQITGGKFSSFRGVVTSLSNGVAYTMFTMTADFTAYLVTVSGSASSSAYSETAIVHLNNTSVSVTIIADGGAIAISNSGLNVQVTQSSGGTLSDLYWSAMRIL